MDRYQDSENFCNICRERNENNHKNTDGHRFNFLLYSWNEYKRPLAQNRHGVELNISLFENQNNLSCHYNSRKGKYTYNVTTQQFINHKCTVKFKCKVKNERKDEILLTKAVLLHPLPLFRLTKYNVNNIFQLEPKSNYNEICVEFNMQTPQVGSWQIPIALNFQPKKYSENLNKDERAFTIARSIVIDISDEDHIEEVKESPFKSTEWSEVKKIIPPIRVPHYQDQYTIPLDHVNAIIFGLEEGSLKQEGDRIVLQKIKNAMYPGKLTIENYHKFFHILLWLEEMGQQLAVSKYNMTNVQMKVTVEGNLLLEVPGLAEKRPSVVANDLIEMRLLNDHTVYQGIVKKVYDKTVEIQHVDNIFVSAIRNYPTMETDVRFKISRLSFERMHAALDKCAASGLITLLFPKAALNHVMPVRINLQDYEFQDKNLLKNKEQKTAVENILNCTSGKYPYIVFGPPGTGKTVTIVEAIVQMKLKTSKRILVCAPSNAACDMLATKLMMYCKKGELIRVHSETVDRGNISRFLREYSNINSDGSFDKIPPKLLMQYRIVITTLVLIGRESYKREYFPDVVFVDEAAQALEPEVLIPLSFLAPGKQIVLAGDPKQLGPSCTSKKAIELGLDIPLLERLMNFEAYRNGNENFMTMLKLNYRSHPQIIKIPNNLFYENNLVSMAILPLSDPVVTFCVFNFIQGMGKSNGLRNGVQALEFYGVSAKEQREGKSPSYYNIKEMEMVLKYVKTLLSLKLDPRFKVQEKHIGIITPYIRQVYKIKDCLRRNNYEDIEVGTTESFQGREKRIIIISTVRAQQNLLLYDRKYNLGFVRNSKRFNVAITRAMSKLIVIGNPYVLGTDSKWLEYIKMCQSLGTYGGTSYIRRTQEVKSDITERLRHVKNPNINYSY